MSHRVVFFLHSPAGGGMERVTLELASGLERRGHDVSIVTCHADGPLVEEMHTVHWHDLDVTRTRNAVVPLRRFLADVRPSHLISALPEPNLVALAATAGTRGISCIVTTHADPRAEARHMPTRKDRMLTRLAPRAYRAADAAVAVSDGVASALISLGTPAARVVAIPNPTIGSDFDRIAAQAPRHPWLADRRGPVIVGAARLVPGKDFRTLIDAFARLRALTAPDPAGGPGPRLIIFGEGEQRHMLETQAADLGLAAEIDLPGFTKQLPAELRAADVFALSSRWEGYGNVLVESMAVGTPVVSTDCPSGPSEVLVGGEFGWLVPVGDPAALARSLGEALAAASDAPQRLIDHARSIGTTDTAVSRYEALLDRTAT